MDEALDHEAVAKRALRPGRAGLAAVTAALVDIVDAREAWETLAVRGLIPDDWFENDARRFQAGPPVIEEPFGYVRGEHEPGDQVFVFQLDRAAGYRPSRMLRVSRGFRTVESLHDGDFVVRCGRFDVRAAERPGWSPFPPTMNAVVGLAADIAAASSAEALAREHFGDSQHLVHWRSVDDDEAERLRREAVEHALSSATPKELRAVLALGYFVRGLDGDRAIEIVCPERVEAEPPD